jgi:hypothetical protein
LGLGDIACLGLNVVHQKLANDLWINREATAERSVRIPVRCLDQAVVLPAASVFARNDNHAKTASKE